MWTEFLQNTWATLFFSVLRPMLKWILHKVTGKCELLRITYSYPQGAKRTKYIERSLRRSRNSYLKQLAGKDDILNLSEATKEVMKIKDIVPEVHSVFEQSCKVCLCQMCGYKRLRAEVEVIRTTKYDSQNQEHEEKLQQLWKLLMPDVKLEKRITKQWTDIGFQGEDPMTDFRGMGMLGLNQLLYLASSYTDKSRSLLSHSKHPKYGYSYAIVSINMTSLLYEIFSNGALRTHFYNIINEKPSVQDFHEVYCYLFFQFDKFWIDEKPKDIMEFGRVRKKFKQEILHRLMTESTTVLKMDVSKESYLSLMIDRV